ncbi:hypothetical protein PIB30_093394 [Stylosanthes scabra]|uniref:Uncharacterized protein n=1 Tax=Stylosanthes scabra TaxID=79078 RepID=A0ABU6YUM8_9FABA|nr:hypothetical protein [Stylosanthes scabra]
MGDGRGVVGSEASAERRGEERVCCHKDHVAQRSCAAISSPRMYSGNKSDNMVSVRWVPLLEDLDAGKKLSWGLVVTPITAYAAPAIEPRLTLPDAHH